jgi:hypothetical protein
LLCRGCCNTIKIDKIAAPAIRSYKFNRFVGTTDFSKIVDFGTLEAEIAASWRNKIIY